MRKVWETVTVAAMAAAALGLGAVPAHAVGATDVPTVQAVVWNACTNEPVTSGLAATLKSPAGGQRTGHLYGSDRFVLNNVAAGTYRMMVRANGVRPLADATGPGVTITVDPGPTGVPAGDFVNYGLSFGITLWPPGPCHHHGVFAVGGAVGTIRDSRTGGFVSHVHCAFTDRTGQNEGPCLAAPYTYSGFVQANLTPQTWNFAVSATSHPGFSNVKVKVPPVPLQKIGTVTQGIVLGIGLKATT